MSRSPTLPPFESGTHELQLQSKRPVQSLAVLGEVYLVLVAARPVDWLYLIMTMMETRICW